MAFVTRERWGRGIGTALTSGLHQHAGNRGWYALTLWTCRSKTAAQRLYASGYRPSGRTSWLPSGDQIVQLRHG